MFPLLQGRFSPSDKDLHEWVTFGFSECPEAIWESKQLSVFCLTSMRIRANYSLKMLPVPKFLSKFKFSLFIVVSEESFINLLPKLILCNLYFSWYCDLIFKRFYFLIGCNWYTKIFYKLILHRFTSWTIFIDYSSSQLILLFVFFSPKYKITISAVVISHWF